MNKIIGCILFLLPFYVLQGQSESKPYVEFSFGRSIHGTGDTPGYHYGFSFGQEFSRKFYWQLGFEGTLNDSPDFLLFYELRDGERVDASLHTVTAGFQIVGGIKYNFVETSTQQLGLAILPLLRYQATSLSDINSVLFPGATGLPIPLRNSVRFSSGRTFSVGASLRLSYTVHMGNTYYLGMLGAVQWDTNGDSLPHFGLVFGKRF